MLHCPLVVHHILHTSLDSRIMFGYSDSLIHLVWKYGILHRAAPFHLTRAGANKPLTLTAHLWRLISRCEPRSWYVKKGHVRWWSTQHIHDRFMTTGCHSIWVKGPQAALEPQVDNPWTGVSIFWFSICWQGIDGHSQSSWQLQKNKSWFPYIFDYLEILPQMQL